MKNIGKTNVSQKIIASMYAKTRMLGFAIR